MTSLLTRLWPPVPRAEHLTFTVYTRAQCCCCHKALDVLKDAQAAVWLRDRGQSISTAIPNLVAQFDTEVPVVALNGKVRFRGVVNPALLDRLLSPRVGSNRRRCSPMPTYRPGQKSRSEFVSGPQNAIGFLSIRRTATNWPEWFRECMPAMIKSVPTVGANGGSLPSRVSSRSESVIGVEHGLRRGSLRREELEIFVLADEARVGQLLVLEVVCFLETVGQGGAEPGLTMSSNICSATIRCPS